MKPLDYIIILGTVIILTILAWTDICLPQEPQPIVEELLEKTSDLEKNIAYAIWNKKRLTYTIWIIRDITRAHLKEAKGYGTTGSFYHWSKKYKYNPKIDILEEATWQK